MDCEVVDPFCIQAHAGVLSVATRILGQVSGDDKAAKVLPVTTAANSNALLVVVPAGLLCVRTVCCTAGGKGARQRKCRAGCCKGIQKPPIPSKDASVAATTLGCVGTKVWSGAGLWWI